MNSAAMQSGKRKVKVYEDIDRKIPPILPLPKGGIIPLFDKEG